MSENQNDNKPRGWHNSEAGMAYVSDDKLLPFFMELAAGLRLNSSITSFLTRPRYAISSRGSNTFDSVHDSPDEADIFRRYNWGNRGAISPIRLRIATDREITEEYTLPEHYDPVNNDIRQQHHEVYMAVIEPNKETQQLESIMVCPSVTYMEMVTSWQCWKRHNSGQISICPVIVEIDPGYVPGLSHE